MHRNRSRSTSRTADSLNPTLRGRAQHAQRWPARALLAAALLAAFAAQAQNPNDLTAAAEAPNREPEQLETITVTAQKIVQDIREVPLAVSVVEGTTLDRSLTVNTQSLQFMTPSLTFGQSSSRRGSSLRIRGIGTAAFSDGVEQSVGTVVDGVTMGRQAQGFVDMFDIDRIEVLRGPQGTLFGKGSSAGLINVITRNPTDTFEGSGEVSLTDENANDARATISGPISPGITARLALRHADREGFSRNVTKGTKVDGKEEMGLRAKVNIAPSDTWSLLLSADWSKADSECCNLLPRSASPNFQNLLIRNGLRLNGRPSNTIVPSPSNREVSVNAKTGTEDSGFGWSATFASQLLGADFTSITAQRHFDVADFVDADSSPINVFDTSGTDSQIEQISQEFRLSGGDDALTWLTGVYFFDQSVDSALGQGGRLQLIGPLGPNGFPTDLITTVDSVIDTRSLALFGQGTWQLGNDFDLTAGLRAERNTLDAVQTQIARFPLVGGGLSFTLPSAQFPNVDTNVSDSALSGKLALGYRFSDETRSYFSVTRGYKGPAFDTLARSRLIQVQNLRALEPEVPTQLEAGLRSTLLDNRVQLNLTAFRTITKDYQAPNFDPASFSFVLQNAGELRSQGLELEVLARPSSALDLTFNMAYIDAIFDQFLNVDCFPGQTAAQGCVRVGTDPANGAAINAQNISGKPLNNSPKFSGNIAAEYSFDLLGLRSFVRGEVAARGPVTFAINQNPRTRQGGYALANLYFGVEEERYTAQFFVKNVFDRNYAENIFNTPIDLLFESQVLGEPRTYGVRFAYYFD